VTGDDSLVFQTEILIQTPFLCCCMMENHFLKFKMVTNSLTY